MLAREENADRYDLEAFYSRVAARAELKRQAAVERTGQVFSVLQQAVSAGELEDMFQSLPGEYQELLKQEPPGPALS